MTVYRYRITWKRQNGLEFVTVFMKDFAESLDEVQRALDVSRLLPELHQYKGLNILRIEEVE
jgi:hypothetical protein